MGRVVESAGAPKPKGSVQAPAAYELPMRLSSLVSVQTRDGEWRRATDSHDEPVKGATLHSLSKRLVILSSAEVDMSTLDDKQSRPLYHSLAKPSQKSNAPTILYRWTAIWFGIWLAALKSHSVAERRTEQWLGMRQQQ